MSTVELGHVVVVGGGLAAARSCEQLREQGHAGRITLIAAEAHLPYDRPPLSKDVLLGELDATTLRVDYEALKIDVRQRVRATGLRPTERVLVTDGGEIPYDGAILATGANPIRMPGEGEQLTLRTLDDALTLRQRLVPGARVVVIGASWIGAEVATAARTRGCQVTCVELDALPLARLMGDDVGKRIVSWWDGIDLRLGTAVAAVESGGVQLADGTLLPADVVVTGVGVRPATAWLEGSGLELDRGVVTDEWLRAAPGIVAVGDLAAWWSRRYDTRMRVEHWDDASGGPGVAVAALLAPGLGETPPHDPVPYFWSDQLGHKLQYVGRHTESDQLIWRERENGSWTALWLAPDGKLAAALIADLPRENAQAQMAIMRGLVLDPTSLADPAVPLTKAVRPE
ncbi:FAD-dependent oxidoreductase [Sporichthya sp.]|uniref:NAD(P)/FAD-dependent oxidoreductase n=1 Tax=Sporichthya sp. TaxID=65475 RepID=UPI0017D9532E|nr:FAD-dependent oxidoreductase [Sporichthya sp.]MBA3743569.1 FAD-dependent oxidoreductase [Sporichthya sp.]